MEPERVLSFSYILCDPPEPDGNWSRSASGSGLSPNPPPAGSCQGAEPRPAAASFQSTTRTRTGEPPLAGELRSAAAERSTNGSSWNSGEQRAQERFHPGVRKTGESRSRQVLYRGEEEEEEEGRGAGPIRRREREREKKPRWFQSGGSKFSGLNHKLPGCWWWQHHAGSYSRNHVV